MPTPAEIDAMSDYTDAQLLKLWRKADSDLAASGVSYAINGRTLTRNNASEVTAKIKFYEERIDAVGDGGFVLVQYGERY